MANVTVRWNGAAAVAAVRAGLASGVNLAAERLGALSVPLVPYLDGDLTGSQTIHQATPASVEEGAQVQYDTAYAAYQHEGGDGTRVVRKYSRNQHPNAGSHFLSRPLESNARELQQIIATAVKGSLA